MLKLPDGSHILAFHLLGLGFWMCRVSIVSFSFPVSLIVAQFTIFGSFRVLNIRSRFEALNDIFLASNGRDKY